MNGQTIHALIQVTDNGAPPLTSFQRVVVTVRRERSRSVAFRQLALPNDRGDRSPFREHRLLPISVSVTIAIHRKGGFLPAVIRILFALTLVASLPAALARRPFRTASCCRKDSCSPAVSTSLESWDQYGKARSSGKRQHRHRHDAGQHLVRQLRNHQPAERHRRGPLRLDATPARVSSTASTAFRI